MKKTTAFLLSTLVVTALLLTNGCGNSQGNSEKTTIAVSILPQEYFVKRIAGDLFSINVMIPPGASPATYEPTPAQLASLSASSLYLKMGFTGFEMAYMEKLRSANRKMTVINLSEGVQLITEATVHGEAKANETTAEHDATGEYGTAAGHGHGEDHEAHAEHASTDDHGHHHGGIDPHTWLSPKNVKIIARNIHDALAAAYPEHKEVFAANLKSFIAELDQLDNHIEQELGSLSSRAFFTYHPSLSYFARDYHLEQHPLELGGKTPSAAHMKKLIDKGREEKIGAVFLQMQFDQKNAEVLAREIGAEIIQINPLDPEWYDQMLFITEKLKENLQ